MPSGEPGVQRLRWWCQPSLMCSPSLDGELKFPLCCARPPYSSAMPVLWDALALASAAAGSLFDMLATSLHRPGNVRLQQSQVPLATAARCLG